ncbi:MAG: energy-coupling factor transporter transmembrane component T [Candidatus Zixiibacteriota bacterium]
MNPDLIAMAEISTPNSRPSAPDVSVKAPPEVGAVHLDPRVLLIGFLSIAAWLTSTRSIFAAGTWLVVSVILGGIARRHVSGYRTIFRRLRWAMPMALIVLILYVLFAREPGNAIADIGGLIITDRAVDTGIHLALRLLGFVVLAGLLTDLTSPSGLAAGITRLLLPLRAVGVKVQTLYHLVFFTTRMAPLIAEELRTIRLGQKSRGIRFEGSLPRRVRASLSLIVPAFASAIRRSERLSLALATRGFDPDRIPASVSDLRFAPPDFLLLIALAAGWIVWLILSTGGSNLVSGG